MFEKFFAGFRHSRSVSKSSDTMIRHVLMGYSQPQLVFRRQESSLYRVWDTALERPTLIKVIKSREKGLAEARRLSQFSHPGVLGLYNTFTSPHFGQVLILEHAYSLDWRSAFEKMTATQRLASILPLLEYLRELHRLDTYHGYLSPHSLWLDRETSRFRLVGFSPLTDGPKQLEAFTTPDHEEDQLGPWTDVYQIGLFFHHFSDLLPQVADWVPYCCHSEPRVRWSMKKLEQEMRELWSDERLVEELDFAFEFQTHWHGEDKLPSD